MRAYSLAHLSDAVLLRDLAALVAQDRTTTANLLAHIAEVDARRLYLPAGCPSMFAYCVDQLRLSEDAAYKRIQAARAARQFPVLFAALADGRLHLTAVGLLAPHLTPENIDVLLEASAHRRKSEIEQLLAQRFPGPEVRAKVRPITATPHSTKPQHSTGHVGAHEPDLLSLGELAPAQVGVPAPRSDVDAAPPRPERYLLQLTIGKTTHDKLRYAQGLLGHSVPSGDVALVLDRALDALIGQLEKQKFAATGRPRSKTQPRLQPRPQTQTKPLPRPGDDPRPGEVGLRSRRRYIPAQVRRRVWERDRGQCTFVGDGGHRCLARKFLEFDHVDPVARGGQATIDRMRLRCRAHNQYEAECTFGAGFMSAKREEARARSRAGTTTVRASGRVGSGSG